MSCGCEFKGITDLKCSDFINSETPTLQIKDNHLFLSGMDYGKIVSKETKGDSVVLITNKIEITINYSL